MTGYLHHQYAASLAEWGDPVHLSSSRGWLLSRCIPETGFRDLMGCYPVFCCEDFTRLHEDIAQLSGTHVSLALVADLSGGYDEPLLRKTFDRLVAFKSHFFAELNRPWEQIASKHHRYYARKSLAKLVVEPVLDLPGFLDTWCDLYGNLVRRHGLRGIKAFSRNSFALQLGIPGLVGLRAVNRDQIVGAHLWMTHDGVAHSHLAAFSDEGYELMAAYALYAGAIHFFTGKVRWLNFGSGAGLSGEGTDGLTQFKRGWATTTRTAWFCAKVLQPEHYTALSALRCKTDTNYFPAYRHGEF
jgi:hypothetical protein